jgi:glycosyltransferase involved in cell wall biosynthesis
MVKNLRVLQVVPAFSNPFGGPVTVVRSVSKELAKRHEVTVYTTTALDSKHDFKPKEEEIDGYRVVYFDRTLKELCYSGMFGQLNLSFDMMKAIKRNLKRFDIVHVHSWQQFPDILVHHYATMYGVPYVLQVHGSIPRIMTKKKLKWIYDILFGYSALRDASKVIALSQVEAKQYNSMNVPRKKIEVIPNGIDLSEYSRLPSKGCFRRKFSIDDDEKIVLYLGRIHRIKGIDILVNAFANTLGKLENTRLAIVGPDDGYLSDLEALIKALKIANNVLISGPLYGRDKLKAYVDADVYVLPSRYETFPMSILEAVACETPIILTENCGITECFRDKAGLVVKADSLNLQEALLEMLMNGERRRVFRENCKTVMQRFSISETVSKLERVYEDVQTSSKLRARKTET